MSKLLRANFRRLFKSKFFWISSAFMFLLGLLPIDHYYANLEYIANNKEQYNWPLEEGFFNYAIALFFIVTIMTVLFIGIEYAGGTIRNKIVVGHKRTTIYLSNLLTLVTADLIWSGIYVITALAVGIPLLGMFECGLLKVSLFIVVTGALTVALTAIMLLISMLCSNRTHSAILCLMLTFALMFAGVIINSILEEPEYYDGYTMLNTETGEMTKEEREPNPNYVRGIKRRVLEELEDATPGGQMIQIAGMTVESFEKLAIYDLVILVCATGIGIFYFKRKDLK